MIYHLMMLIGITLVIIYVLTRATMEGFVGGVSDNTYAPSGKPSPLTICEDEPLDLPWIASWSAADRKAREGQICAPYYKEAGPAGTQLWIVSKTCEQGLAHTRDGDRIIIPDNIHIGEREATIQHELIHISQRRHPAEWEQFYRRNWAFEIQDSPPTGIPTELIAARRSNPDTWRQPWCCWMGRWWPVAIYTSTTSPQLRDAQTVWWDAWRQKTFQEPPTEWVAFFGRPAQEEHPHEIAAVLAVAEDRTTEAGRRLSNWLQSRLTLLKN